MITFIRNWLDGRLRAQVHEQYRRGYNWAAGELLLGVDVAGVMRFVDDAGLFGDCDPFDAGAEAACRDWGKLVEMRS